MECCVLYLAGQSNSHAHQRFMKDEDIVKEPLKHVFMLGRGKNQSLHAKCAVWSGFSSYGTDLAEAQDATYTSVSYLAKRWEKDCEDGSETRDLFIVEIGIGAEGIARGDSIERNRMGMWHPDMEPHLIPGQLGEVDISLYPFAVNTYQNVYRDLSSRYDSVKTLGYYWLGSEQDTLVKGENLGPLYVRTFNGLLDAVGFPCTLFINLFAEELLVPNDGSTVYAAFDYLKEHYERPLVFLSPYDIPGWKRGAPWESGHAVSSADRHMMPVAQQWFADRMYENK